MFTKLITSSCAILISGAFATAVHAQTSIREPASQHQPRQVSRVATLTPEAGNKWVAGDPLWNGIQEIQQAMALAAHQCGVAQSASLSETGRMIQAKVVEIVQRTRLEQEAAAELRVVLAKLVEGSGELTDGSPVRQSAGVDKVNDALKHFYAHFDAKPRSNGSGAKSAQLPREVLGFA
jgi:hypothetical protein